MNKAIKTAIEDYFIRNLYCTRSSLPEAEKLLKTLLIILNENE